MHVTFCTPASRHAPCQFAVGAGELLVGGIPLPRLAARVGQTPFFAYDRQLLDEPRRPFARRLPRTSSCTTR